MATTFELPKEFDVVVLGTGMPESIVAAACSRIGQRVLHIDKNYHYSGDWASFSLKGIESWVQQHQYNESTIAGSRGELLRPVIDESRGELLRPIEESSLLEDGETLIELPLDTSNFSHVHAQYHVQETDEDDEKELSDTKAESCDKIETVIKTDESKKQSDISPGDGSHEEITVDAGGATAGGKEGSMGDVDAGEGTTEGKQGSIREVDPVDGTTAGIQGSMGEVGAGDGTTEGKQGSIGDINEMKDDSRIDTDSDMVERKLPHLATSDIESQKPEIAVIDVVEETREEQPVTKRDAVENVESDKKQSVQESMQDKVVEPDANPAPQHAVENYPSKRKWTVKRLKAKWIKFNLDLSPKVLYSVGDMVELLISSDIAKYCDFKTITQVITLRNGILEQVPCSRADVFSSKKVGMLEKRMLMKFLQFCVQYENKPEDISDFLERPFVDFLTSKKLTPTIKHYIQHSIAMATDTMTTRQGLEKMKKFLQSIGRYGNTAYLWSQYGSGELPQSFCRMCAVFGGVYCLRMSASSLVMDSDNRCCGIINTEGQKIKCKWLIMEGSYAPASFICQEQNSCISRAIIMADTPLLTPDQQQQLSLMSLPCPDDGDRPISVLELPPSSMAAPAGVYIYHVTRKGKDGVQPKDDLTYAVTTLFSYEGNVDESKPNMLWSLYYTQHDRSQVQPSTSVAENVVLMAGPGTDIDIDRPVQEAKEVFKRILPDEDFLPKAPNPEDIIYVDDSEAQVADASSQSEFAETDQSEGSSLEIKSADQPECTKAVSIQSDNGSHENVEASQSECSKTEVNQSERSSEDLIEESTATAELGSNESQSS